jgi:hypothetical protein
MVTAESKISIKLDKNEYYENEVITGMVKMRLSQELRDFLIRITLTYEENYVLFNEDGDTALLSKDLKKKLVQHDIECKEVYQK